MRMNPYLRQLAPYFHLFPLQQWLIKKEDKSRGLSPRDIKRWLDIHPGYLSEQESLELALTLMEHWGSFEQIHPYLEQAITARRKETKQKATLALCILHFEQIFRTSLGEQKNHLRLAQYHGQKSLKLRPDCLLTHLHLILILVAKDQLSEAIKLLHQMSKVEIDGQRPMLFPVYMTLEKIYHALGKGNWSLYYRLKRENGRIPLSGPSQKSAMALFSVA